MVSTSSSPKVDKTQKQISLIKTSNEYIYASKLYFKSKLLLDLMNRKYDIHITDDRWQEEFICCKKLNPEMDQCFITHMSGSNEGSPLIVKPYTSYYTDKIIDGESVEFVRIYSDPFEYFIGDHDSLIGADIPRVNWEERLEHEHINKEINCFVAKYFIMQYNMILEHKKKCTDEAKLKYIEDKLKNFDIENLKRKYKI